jgi:hypothetical protein
MSWDVESASWLAVAGVAYDIAGAMMLSYALMWSRPQDLARQSAGSFDMNTELLRAFCEQTVDARWGATFLIGGFLLQAASSAGVKIASLAGATLGVVLLIMLAIYMSLRRDTIKRRCIAAIDALDEKEAWTAEVKHQLRDQIETKF